MPQSPNNNTVENEVMDDENDDDEVLYLDDPFNDEEEVAPFDHFDIGASLDDVKRDARSDLVKMDVRFWMSCWEKLNLIQSSDNAYCVVIPLSPANEPW